MEKWAIIEDHDNYMVSSSGRIKSIGIKAYTVHRNGKIFTRNMPSKILRLQNSGHKANKSKYGYWKVSLGRSHQASVHRLVAKAFVPNPYNKQCVDHINRDSRDNRALNLRWVTYKENMANR